MSGFYTGNSFVGPPAPADRFMSDFADGLETAGPIVSIMGAVNGAIGSFFAAQSQQNVLKSQAQNQAFAAEMNRINAQGSEFSAQQTLLAGEREFGRLTLASGQRLSSAKAAMAARGIQAGDGSAAEVVGSLNLINEIDKMTMSAASVRQAEAYRTQGTNFANQATMAGVSANNLNATAGTISPGLAAGTSLLSSATSVADSWLRSRKFNELIAANSGARF